MGDYVQIGFEDLDDQKKELIIAILSGINYEGFEDRGDLLRAYIPAEGFDPDEVKAMADSLDISFTVETIKARNWNKEWESSFSPVIITHPVLGHPWVRIRAAFHDSEQKAEHEILITPKMSFGTGHHATTSLMIKMMSGVDFNGKSVLDFGTGTGVLAILSFRLGAANIFAIDIDSQSIENANENFNSNNLPGVTLINSSSADTGGRFDIILANIIKQVILDNLSSFANQLVSSGTLLLSGLLEGDEDDILGAAAFYGFALKDKTIAEGWMCLQMTAKRS